MAPPPLCCMIILEGGEDKQQNSTALTLFSLFMFQPSKSHSIDENAKKKSCLLHLTLTSSVPFIENQNLKTSIKMSNLLTVSHLLFRNFALIFQFPICSN